MFCVYPALLRDTALAVWQPVDCLLTDITIPCCLLGKIATVMTRANRLEQQATDVPHRLTLNKRTLQPEGETQDVSLSKLLYRRDRETLYD